MAPTAFSRLAEQRLKLQREKQTFIDLSEGTPDFPPPAKLVEKLRIFCDRPDVHGYASINGLDSLKKQSLDHLEQFQINSSACGVLQGAGTKEIIALIALAFLEPGDIVLVPALHYPFYSSAAKFAGARVVEYPLSRDGRYLPELFHLSPQVLTKAKILWLNYPHNPTSVWVPQEVLTQCVDFCRQNGIVLCSDLAYSHLTFGCDFAPSALGRLDHPAGVIEVHSMSKNLNISGWRAGFAAGDPMLIERVKRTRQLFNCGLFVPIQKAVRYGLLHFNEFSREIKDIYQNRARLVSNHMDRLEMIHVKPGGTFYIWIKVPDPLTDKDFSQQLLEQYRVLVTPGETFGEAGQGWIRLSLTRPEGQLEEAMDRIGRYLANVAP